jgi:hypothetical protein
MALLLFPLVLFALITLMPVKWAAGFVEAGNTSYGAAAIAAITAPAVSLGVFKLAGGGFMGFVFAFMAGIAVYAAIFRVPGRSLIGFSIMVIALQAAVLFALISFGVKTGQGLVLTL